MATTIVAWASLLACARGGAAYAAGHRLPPVPAQNRALTEEQQIDLERLLQRGQRAQQAGHYERAATLYFKAAAMSPREPRARLGLAEAWLMVGVATDDEELRNVGCCAAQQAAQLRPDDEHAGYLASVCRAKTDRVR